ncbi:MAG TPA: nucleoside monophosphate kinase [Patescibacteria group bacterium]
MIYIFVGPPASGKSTQAKLLAKELGYPYVSVSSLLRERVAREPHLREVMKEGDLLPSYIVEEALDHYFTKHPDNVVIDGAFRRGKEVNTLARIWKEAEKVAILMVTSHDIIRHRALGRNEGREDDDPTVVEHRIRLYDKTVPSIIEHVEANDIPLIRVDGNQSIEAIHKNIVGKLIHDHTTKDE